MKVIIALILIAFQGCSFSNKKTLNCTSCDIQQLVSIYQSAKIDDEKLDLLFCLNKTDCTENIEFSQLMNETIFTILQNDPDLFCSKMENFEKNKFILTHLQNPISDEINISDIIIRIESVSNNATILESLRIANSKI